MDDKKQLITKKDLRKSWALWYFFVGFPSCYERLIALSFCGAMGPILKKLYNKEELKKALKRHLTFYITEPTLGGCLNGIVIAMEEQYALKGECNQDEENMIINIKTGLMGPLAGAGDALIWAGLMPMLIAMFLPLANQGSILGALLPFIFWLGITISISYIMFMNGYNVGKKTIISLFQSGKIKNMIEVTSILGLFMMGALSANYTKISTKLMIDIENTNPLVIQDILNSIIPGMLELLTVFFIYFYIRKKGPKYLQIIGVVTLISLIGSYFKIL